MSAPDPAELEQELRAEAEGWREGYLVRLYPDTRKGLELQAVEEGILGAHGYVTQSSELAREGSLMVAYVREEVADEYTSLAHPGLEAASDPDSFVSRFGRPIAWIVVIAVFAFAAWLLLMALA